MMFKTKLYFWFLVAKTLDWYVVVLMKIALRQGMCKRERIYSTEKYLDAVDFKYPERSFYAFADKTRPLVLKEETKDCGSGLLAHEITFSSAFPTSIKENDTVYATLYRGEPPSELVIIFVGPFRNSKFDPFERWMARFIARQGFDCCYIELPYTHRRSPLSRRGCFVTRDPLAVADSFIQGVLDVDRLYQILTEYHGYKKLGIVGISAGGSIALAHTFLKPYEGAAAIITGASFASVVWNAKGPLWQHVREGVRSYGYDFNDLEIFWSIQDVTKYQGTPRCNRFLLINGIFDDFITREQAVLLHRSLQNSTLPPGNPARDEEQRDTFTKREVRESPSLKVGGSTLIWYPVSHYSAPLLAKPALRNVIRFFKREPLKETGFS